MINVEINLRTIRLNIKTLKKHLGKNVKICAVVKANAYSLGDTKIATAINNHIDCFAVAHLDEARRLRNAGITKDILLFGVCLDYKTAVDLGLTISVNSVKEITDLSSKASKPVKVHIKVNAGMNRHGVSTLWQLRKIVDIAKSNTKIKIEGLYTHLAHEEDNIAGIDAQLKTFNPFRILFKRHFPKGIIHAACAGSAHYPAAQFDMVRVGKSFYGGYDGYKTAITINAKVVSVQNIARGETVGYGGTFTAISQMKVAAVSCGYADVVHFNFSNRASVQISNVPCKILGKVCMDSFMIDVSHIDKPLGKTVTIIAPRKGLTIMDQAKVTNTVTCNLLCSLNFSRASVTYKG